MVYGRLRPGCRTLTKGVKRLFESLDFLRPKPTKFPKVLQLVLQPFAAVLLRHICLSAVVGGFALNSLGGLVHSFLHVLLQAKKPAMPPPPAAAATAAAAAATSTPDAAPPPDAVLERMRKDKDAAERNVAYYERLLATSPKHPNYYRSLTTWKLELERAEVAYARRQQLLAQQPARSSSSSSTGAGSGSASKPVDKTGNAEFLALFAQKPATPPPTPKPSSSASGAGAGAGSGSPWMSWPFSAAPPPSSSSSTEKKDKQDELGSSDDEDAEMKAAAAAADAKDDKPPKPKKTDW